MARVDLVGTLVELTMLSARQKDLYRAAPTDRSMMRWRATGLSCSRTLEDHRLVQWRIDESDDRLATVTVN